MLITMCGIFTILNNDGVVSKDIVQEQFEKGIPIIKDYINWLKLFQKQ